MLSCFSFLSRHSIRSGRGCRERAVCVCESLPHGRVPVPRTHRVCSPHRPRRSRRARRAVRQHHLQEPAASRLQHVHLLRPEPEPLEIQASSALFRTGISSPLSAPLRDHPHVTFAASWCPKIKPSEAAGPGVCTWVPVPPPRRALARRHSSHLLSVGSDASAHTRFFEF